MSLGLLRHYGGMRDGTALPAQHAPPQDRPPGRADLLLALPLALLFPLGLSLLILAAVSPQTPPSALGFAQPEVHDSIWSLRLGPANIFELGVLLIGAVLAVQRVALPLARFRSRLDPMMLGIALVAVAATSIAMLRGLPSERYTAGDVEHLAIPLAAYFVATRTVRDKRKARIAAVVLGTVLAVHAIQLVIVHGVIGSTMFGTARNQTALLITEDSLLVGLPLVLLWGLVADGRARWWVVCLTLGFAAFVYLVDIQSLRRGALIFISLALLARSARIRKRRLVVGAVACAALIAGLYAAGPLRAPVENAVYTVRSAVGLEGDNSTEQHGGELRAYGRNTGGIDHVIGRGFGTPWRNVEPGPIELGSFGSGETATERIGWHVYGLDWLYKVGLLGVAAVIALLTACILRVRDAIRRLGPADAGIAWSLAVLLPALWLLSLTNLRVGCFAGAVTGLLSIFVDAAGQRDRRRGWPAPSARS